MADMQSQINAILGNPQMMEQIMSLAQNMQATPEPQPTTAEDTPEIDFAMIQKLTSLIGKTGVDSHQKTLLQALGPYLSTQRIQKLERAMRAAKLANMATMFLGNAGR